MVTLINCTSCYCTLLVEVYLKERKEKSRAWTNNAGDTRRNGLNCSANTNLMPFCIPHSMARGSRSTGGLVSRQM